VKDRRMKNGEVFNADSCCDLIVNNSVHNRCRDTQTGYLEGFHASILRRVPVSIDVTSLLHSLSLKKGEGKAHTCVNAWLQQLFPACS
jgi:hypothetical protein